MDPTDMEEVMLKIQVDNPIKGPGCDKWDDADDRRIPLMDKLNANDTCEVG